MNKSEPFVEDSTLLSIITRSTRSLLNDEIEKTGLIESSQNEFQESIQPQPTDSSIPATRLRRIRRGLSARHYLRNLTKNWDQTLLESFVKDGKLNRDEIEFNGNSSLTSTDDLSLSLPPLAYRFDQSWMSAAVDMRSYKFVRAQDFDPTRGFISLSFVVKFIL